MVVGESQRERERVGGGGGGEEERRERVTEWNSNYEFQLEADGLLLCFTECNAYLSGRREID